MEVEPLVTEHRRRRPRFFLPLAIVFFAVIGGLVVWLALSPTTENDQPIIRGYDVIVVGAGTAGSVLASRLAGMRFNESRNVSVLILEGGGPSLACNGGPVFLQCYLGNQCLDGPNAGYSVFDVALFDSLTRTAAMNTSWGSKYPKRVGKCYGGSAAVNDYVWLRGHANDFNAMATKFNLSGWDWETALSYYKKIETYDNTTGDFDPIAHGRNGSIWVTDAQGEYSGRFQQSAANKGYRVGIDVNSANRTEGFGWMQSGLRKGRRSCSGGEFLCPALRDHKANLEIHPFAEVEHLIWGPAPTPDGSPIVTGVAWNDADGRRQASHAKAVVLSAGVWGSPHIMLKSGLGPKEELAGLVQIMRDLPGVGKNLVDEFMVGVYYKYLVWDDPPRHALQSGPELEKWLLSGTGGSLRSTEGGFIKRENSSEFDVHLRYFTDDADAAVHLSPNNWKYGNLTLDPDSFNLVLTNGPKPEADIEELAHGIEVMRQIFAQEPLKSYIEEIEPGLNVSDRDGLKDYVRGKARDYNHAMGSVRMGSADDPMAVLDEKFKVRHVEGLWVCDNSVYPTKISHDSMAAATLAGYRGADFLKQYFGWTE